MELADISLGRRKLKLDCFNFKHDIEFLLQSSRKSAEAKGLVFKSGWETPVPECLRGDFGLISGALAKLFDNAIKFTDSGGIAFSGSCWTGEGDEVELRLSVSDTGEGIAQDKLGAIFDSFVQSDNSSTRRHEGLGLGLSYCRQAVRMMGGVIGVDSVPDSGSEFWIRLPLRTASFEELCDD